MANLKNIMPNEVTVIKGHTLYDSIHMKYPEELNPQKHGLGGLRSDHFKAYRFPFG